MIDGDEIAIEFGEFVVENCETGIEDVEVCITKDELFGFE